MKWSFSTSRIFSQCPRKWYYSQIAANPRSKDPLRREAYLLRQLQTVSAWRGKLVDLAIEKFIVPRIRSNDMPSEDEVIASSMRLMHDQLEFGKERMHRDHDATKSRIGDAYCAFHEIEYDGGLDEDRLKEASDDVIVALQNLIRSEFLKKLIQESSFIVAQRTLAFDFDQTTIRCTPDLIAFFPDQSPLITDWKVHSFANADYRLQLGVYAFALSRTKPHKDFPKNIQSQLEDPTKIRLVEYQLLKNQQREYFIFAEDIAEITDYIFESCTQINRLVNGKRYKELDINLFQTARSPDICSRCNFKKLCWRRNWFEPY